MTEWHLPLKSGRGFAKRPALVTPQATGLGVVLMPEEQLTFAEARRRYAHVHDACEVLDLYIEAGHGDVLMADRIH
ncbi:hypothetical protein [Microbacterium maritypicum]|uniref:Uncharacterized protein n=1 Tax=Microbacterium maritypicum MF109 TaxID=1333857 RepID=T5KHG3_MICMQ|nr:hypothetical protein [Microbacterium liquefaciens]EQM74894.1 hypothetical protein L687_05385 [Microbacterium maritypicum MF109]